MLVSPGETVSVDMDGNSAAFHHWFQTENRLLIAARYQTGLGEDFVVDRVPASQLQVDIDDGIKVGTCRELLITGEPVRGLRRPPVLGWRVCTGRSTPSSG